MIPTVARLRSLKARAEITPEQRDAVKLISNGYARALRIKIIVDLMQVSTERVQTFASFELRQCIPFEGRVKLVSYDL